MAYVIRSAVVRCQSAEVDWIMAGLAPQNVVGCLEPNDDTHNSGLPFIKDKICCSVVQ